MKRFALAVLCVVELGCAEDTCPACDEPQTRGAVANAGLVELSGIAVATRLPDTVYAHNDSADTARLFAMGLDGSDLGEIEVDGADNDDWEDIAIGPCASGSCLFIGDIGDNLGDRTDYAIYVVDEPTEIVASLAAQEVEFTYEDGSRDAEVLLVHPQTGAVTIVDKMDEGPAGIYEIEALVPGSRVTATRAGTLEPAKGSAKFTAGAVHPDATGVLLRTKTRLFHYPMAEGQSVASALLGEPCQLPLADEAQGEAVTWASGGDEFMTVGEGVGAAISVSSCDPS